MAQQHRVLALLPTDRVDAVRTELEQLDGAGVVAVHERRPSPATYRDEEPDRRLHQLVDAGRPMLILGALVGAVVGLVIALLVPGLRDFLPWTAVLLAFGGAWGLGVAFTARAVQRAKREDDLGERTIEVGADHEDRLRLVTVEVDRDRQRVADVLEARGAQLLDSDHPLVGDVGGLTRPAVGGTPEGQLPGRPVDGRGSVDDTREGRRRRHG